MQQVKSEIKLWRSGSMPLHTLVKTSDVYEICKNILNSEIGKRLLIACYGEQVRKSVEAILSEGGLNNVYKIDAEEDFKLVSKKGIGLLIYNTPKHFETPEYLILSAAQLFGYKPNQRSVKRTNIDVAMMQANKLKIGELVVHKNYGIGLFLGIQPVDVLGKVCDMIELRYKNNETIMIPVDNIGMIKKYGGDQMDLNHLNRDDYEGMLDKLGSNSFSVRKKKIKEHIKELADKLLSTAAKRLLVDAKIFEKHAVVDEFYNRFEFIPTLDQVGAIEDIEKDMMVGRPMDRLVCGDVGFGKTEVAMRASFLICGGKVNQYFETKFNPYYHGQVVVVVPTTLLAHQHYKNFTTRFAGTNIIIKEYSRNVAKKDLEKIRQQAKDGEVDILIGTHGLFKNLEFKNLDLLIIDEEQHFGVKQKEALKHGREDIHCLSLSATPIPRTLHMSLSGIRDISIIATPPVDRLVIKTQVMEYDDLILRNAILREKDREGRTFFVCPKIADLEERMEYLKKIVPEVRVAIAHGQMKGDRLDEVMIEFYDGKYDVLLTTSIIESGIDISFANTIIVHKANLFGLSALYQLRGRVGRSGAQAYAYFLIESKQKLNTSAVLRLKTIASIHTLGAGFVVATGDMDIRGAGNLMGDEQSGSIKDVGVEMYQDMVRDMMNQIKLHGIKALNNDKDEDWTPEVKLNISVNIPQDYIADFNTRLEFYKRISSCMTEESLLQINKEMEDRFGLIPQAVLNLVDIIKIKNLCKEIGISRLDLGPTGIIIQFYKDVPKNAEKIFTLVQKKPQIYKIRQNNQLLVNIASIDDKGSITNAVKALRDVQ